MLAWYGGHDVTTMQGLRAFQRACLDRIGGPGSGIVLKANKIPKDIKGNERARIEQALHDTEQLEVVAGDDLAETEEEVSA